MPERVPGVERQIINPVHQQLIMDKLSVQQEIRSEQAALREIGAQIAAVDAKVQKVVEEEKSYGDLVRQRDDWNSQYDRYNAELRAHRARLQAETGSFGAQVEMIDRALLPAKPYRVIYIRMSLACLAGGICIGIALMFLLEFSDHSLRSADDAAAALSIPILCNLTTIQEEKVRAGEHLVTALWIFFGLLFGGGLMAGVWALKVYSPPTFEAVQRLF